MVIADAIHATPRPLARVSCVHLLPGETLPPPQVGFGQRRVDLHREADDLRYHARRLQRSAEWAAQQALDAACAHRLGGRPRLLPSARRERLIESALVTALGIRHRLSVSGQEHRTGHHPTLAYRS